MTDSFCMHEYLGDTTTTLFKPPFQANRFFNFSHNSRTAFYLLVFVGRLYILYKKSSLNYVLSRLLNGEREHKARQARGFTLPVDPSVCFQNLP